MPDHPETVSLRLAEAATPGPYTTQVIDSCGSIVVDVRVAGYVVAFGANRADASHIAHAHPGRVAAWLGCVARLRERVAEGHTGECRNERLRASVLAWATPPCTCGHEDDLAALGAVDAEG